MESLILKIITILVTIAIISDNLIIIQASVILVLGLSLSLIILKLSEKIGGI